MAVVRSSSGGGVAIRFLLPVLLMTSCSHFVASNRRREKVDPTFGEGFSNWCLYNKAI